MNSTNNEKKNFTLQDFEKGLMLAGYISPISIYEVNEKERLKEYDAKNSKKRKEIYFKRTVLAAEIVYELKDELTFGRIKFQKLVYLCENVTHMSLAQDRYKKFAAGPFDSKFMHSINSEFKRQKWFGTKTVTKGKYNKQVYFKLDKVDNYKQYYYRYYSEQHESIHRVINLFRKRNTKFSELIATLFYCWKEIIDKNQLFSTELIIHDFYNWAEEKHQFTIEEIMEGIKWMEKESLTPLLI